MADGASEGGSSAVLAVQEGRVVRASCDVCGSTATSLLKKYTPRDWPLVACASCGFVYLGEVPDYTQLAETFAWDKTFPAERERRRARLPHRLHAATLWRNRLGHWLDRAQIRGTFPAIGRALDVGCSHRCRIPAGLTPFGIEISKTLADAAQPAFEARGGSVVNRPALEALRGFDSGFFSAILMRSYLEHESRPYDVLQEAFRCLSPGGKVFVRVPNFASVNRLVMGRGWCGFRFPDHVNYFTAASLRRMSERAGFRYRRLNWFSPLDDNIAASLVRP